MKTPVTKPFLATQAKDVNPEYREDKFESPRLEEMQKRLAPKTQEEMILG